MVSNKDIYNAIKKGAKAIDTRIKYIDNDLGVLKKVYTSDKMQQRIDMYIKINNDEIKKIGYNTSKLRELILTTSHVRNQYGISKKDIDKIEGEKDALYKELMELANRKYTKLDYKFKFTDIPVQSKASGINNYVLILLAIIVLLLVALAFTKKSGSSIFSLKAKKNI
jgi:hypothetical protein